MLQLTLEQIQELQFPLATFLARRHVDIALTIPGKLRFESLEIRKIQDQEFAEQEFFVGGNSPNDAVACIQFVQRVEGATEEWMMADSELQMRGDLTFVVNRTYAEQKPLHAYLRKALDDFLPTVRALQDTEQQKDSATHFAESIHEELVANAFHPRRMAAWWEELD